MSDVGNSHRTCHHGGVMPAAIIEAEKDAPATPQSTEHARPTGPRNRPSRITPFPPSPADEDDRFFSGTTAQKAPYTPTSPTAAQASSAPIPVEKQAGSINKAMFPSMMASALQMD